jgi:Na+-driven multidrug efflux pump
MGFTRDEAVIDMARNSMRLMGAAIAIDGMGLVLLYALLGADAVRQVMVVAVGTQWLLGLPLAWLAGPYFGLGLFAVWVTQSIYRILQAMIFVVLWRRRGWVGIKL